MARPRVSDESRTPYRLDATLRQHGISQAELCRAVMFETGRRAGQPLASSTISTLIIRRIWPRTASVDGIKRQVETFLASRGVPASDIAQIWIAPDGQLDTPPIDRPLLRPDLNPATPPLPRAEPSAPIDDFTLPEAEMLTPTARGHFSLDRHPFIDDVQGPTDVYLSKEQRYIRESMYYAAKHGGFVAIIGESGSGKSTLRRDLAERIRLNQEPITVIQPQCIDKRALNSAHICDAIIADISTERPKQSLEAKARQIQRILAASARTGASHVLIIEEAHDLAITTLKYLKRFWELEDGFRKLIGIVLVGQPELANKLDEQRNPDAREVIRRIEVARLKPLNGNLEEYLALKFKRIGLTLDDVFEKDAFDAIRTRLTRRRPNTNSVESHLYPLNVHNAICKAMNAAAELGMPKVSAELIGRV